MPKGPRGEKRPADVIEQSRPRHAHRPRRNRGRVALYAVWYIFVKIHKTLKMTPAMASGVSQRLWSVGDIVDLIEAAEAPAPDMGERLVG
jgi:hypothetical protein